MQIIEFTDAQTNQFLGRVEVEDGVATGTNDFAKNMVESYLGPDSGKTAGDFVTRFQGWTNGYIASELITD